MLPSPLTKFEIQKHYQNDVQLRWQNEPKFNSKNNFHKIKDEEDLINLDENESIATYFCMQMVITTQFIFIAWSWINSKRKLKILRKQKYSNIYL